MPVYLVSLRMAVPSYHVSAYEYEWSLLYPYLKPKTLHHMIEANQASKGQAADLYFRQQKLSQWKSGSMFDFEKPPIRSK